MFKESDIGEIVKIVGQSSSTISKIILFGSYARQREYSPPDEFSDLDLAILIEGPEILAFPEDVQEKIEANRELESIGYQTGMGGSGVIHITPISESEFKTDCDKRFLNNIRKEGRILWERKRIF